MARQLRLDLGALVEDINRILEGIVLSKRDMRSWRTHNPVEVYVDQDAGDDQSDPAGLSPLQVEWERLRGRILIDLTLSDPRTLADHARIDHEDFELIAQRTSNVTSVYQERVGAWSRSLGDRAERAQVVKKVSFTAAALAAIPYAAGAAAAWGIEGGGSLALGRFGLGALGGGLVDGGLSAVDGSDPASTVTRTVAGTEDGMLMGAAGPAGEAVGAAAESGAARWFGESTIAARTATAATGGAAEAATAAGTYTTGTMLAHGRGLSAAATAGITAAEESAPFGALLGIAARGLDGVAADPAAAPAVSQTQDSVDAFVVGEVPRSGPARWKYLEDPEHWLPERRALHEQLLAEAKAEAQRFADVQAEQGGPPTIYAMRGNTAVGKSRAAKNDIGELQNAVKATGDMRSVNPDNFKVRLMTAGGRSFTSAQVHSESSMLASRLESDLQGVRTSDGRVGSIMIDKRLATVEDVRHYAQMAKRTGRRLSLYDVDAPLEVSLAGVLERAPGGPDPLPEYNVVGDGFDAVRANRRAVMKVFQNDPALGTYELYVTRSDGNKVLVVRIANGTTDILDADLLAEALADPGEAVVMAAQRVITDKLIDDVVRDLPVERATIVRRTLQRHRGQTWKEALDRHSAERAGTMQTEDVR